MTPFTVVTGAAAVLPIANVDTDIIIRIERLTEGDQSRLGDYAFESLRYRSDGSDAPDFPLNRPGWRHAPILLAGPNFGCGSSREGAVTALAAYGIRCVVSNSFGDIFYANCFQNGLLPVRLAEADVLSLMALSDAGQEDFTVDLVDRRIIAPDGRSIGFDVDPMRRESLLTGLDDLGLTLRDTATIAAWQGRDRATRSWAWEPVELEA